MAISRRSPGFFGSLCSLLVAFMLCSAMVSARGPCGHLEAHADDGSIRIVDFTELWQDSLAQPFVVRDPVGQWTFEFGICADIPCGGSTGAACQETSQPAFYPLGHWPSLPTAEFLNGFPMGAIKLSVAPGGNPLRGSEYTIYCDPTAIRPTNFSVISAPINSNPPYIYQLGLTHVSACGLAPVPATPGLCHNLVAHGPNGLTRTVNLDELSTLTQLTPFITRDMGTGIQYSFGVCQDISCTNAGTPSAGCAITPAPYSFSLGKYPSSISANLTLDGYAYGAIQINIPQYGMQHMLLTVICDYNAIVPSNVFAISPPQDAPPPWTYQMFITHKSACGL